MATSCVKRYWEHKQQATPVSNSALLSDAFSLLRCACGAAKRGR